MKIFYQIVKLYRFALKDYYITNGLKVVKNTNVSNIKLTMIFNEKQFFIL